MSEFSGQGKDSEQFNFAQVGFQQLVISRHSFVSAVKMSCNPGQLCWLKSTSFAFIFQKSRFLQLHGSRVNQIGPVSGKLGIFFNGAWLDSVQSWRPHHTNVEVSVSKPVDGIFHVLDGSQDKFSVEHIGQLGHHLRFHRQLLIEQGQVVLQLRMVGDQNTFSLGVVLRSTGSSKHLEDVQSSQFGPTAFFRIVDLRTFDDDGMSWQIDTPCQC